MPESRTYAGGGVLPPGQLFGHEGRQPEAVIPLPAGRSIPVRIAEREKRELFRAGVAREAPERVERGAEGRIVGLSVVTAGPLKDRPMEVDEKTLEQVVAAGNRVKAGVRSRFGHPNMSSTALGTFLGRMTNFRMAGDRVLADLQFDPTAHATPNGDLASYVMDLAESDAGALGVSMVFEGKHEIKKDEAGDAVLHAELGVPVRLARVKKLWAVDAVDEPAANEGMFGYSPDVELSAAATAALDKILARPDAVETIKGFFNTYFANAKEEEGEQMPEETPTTAGAQVDVEGARKAAREEERARISSIRKAAFSGQDALVDEAIDKGLTLEQAQGKFIEAYKASQGTHLSTIRKDSIPSLGPNPDRTVESPEASPKAVPVLLGSDVADEAMDDVTAEQAWASNPGLRSDFFGDKEIYHSYRRANDKGLVTYKGAPAPATSRK